MSEVQRYSFGTVFEKSPTAGPAHHSSLQDVQIFPKSPTAAGNSYQGPGSSHQAASLHDVLSALDALLAGNFRLEAAVNRVDRDVVTLRDALVKAAPTSPSSFAGGPPMGPAWSASQTFEKTRKIHSTRSACTSTQSNAFLREPSLRPNGRAVQQVRSAASFLTGATAQFSLDQRHQSADIPEDAAAEMPEQRGSRSEALNALNGPMTDASLFGADETRLSPNWPKCVKLRDDLQKGIQGTRRDSQEIISVIVRQASHKSRDSTVLEHHSTGKGVWDPDSLGVVCFDVASFLVLLHDLFITPYVLAFNITSNGLIDFLAYFAVVYWVLDFLIGFNLGYYRNGELVVRRWNICTHYARTWLIPNLLALILDIVNLASQSIEGGDSQNSQYTAQLKFVRVLKVFRLIKVFRLARLVRLTNNMTSWLNLSTGMRTAMQASRIMFCVVLYNHFITCIWCWIGRNTNSSLVGGRWLENLVSRADVDEALIDQHHGYLYVVGYHWAISQMTPGPIDLVAGNIYERVFNILLLLIGLLFCSIIVSLLSGQVTQLIISQRDQRNQLDALETFLRQSSIRRKLAVRVHRQVLERLSIQAPMSENAVTALKLISVGLRQDVLCESRKPLLFSHALFRTWEQIDPSTFRLLCTDATSFAFMAVEDELFSPETQADNAYYLIQGRMMYVQLPETSRVHTTVSQPVFSKTWLCEAAIWSTWSHVGRCEARTPCHLLVLNGPALLNVVEKKSAVAYFVKQYGRSYHLRITVASPPHSYWPSDLHVPYTDARDLCSQYVGLGLFRQALHAGKLVLAEQDREQFEKELTSERSTLHQREDGTLERIVAVVALMLKNEMGMAFVQLGRLKCAEIEEPSAPDVRVVTELPGSKRTIGELPHSALQRILEEDLAPLKDDIVITGAEDDTFTRDSPRYGMRTTYMRTIHTAIMKCKACTALESRKHQINNCPIAYVNEVFVIKAVHGKEYRFFAWLDESDYEELQGPERQEVLRKWLPDNISALVCPNEETHDTAAFCPDTGSVHLVSSCADTDTGRRLSDKTAEDLETPRAPSGGGTERSSVQQVEEEQLLQGAWLTVSAPLVSNV